MHTNFTFLSHSLLLNPLPKTLLCVSYHTLDGFYFFIAVVLKQQFWFSGCPRTAFNFLLGAPGSQFPLPSAHYGGTIVLSYDQAVCHLPLACRPHPLQPYTACLILFVYKMTRRIPKPSRGHFFFCRCLFFEIGSHLEVLVTRTFLFSQRDYKIPLVLGVGPPSCLTN